MNQPGPSQRRPGDPGPLDAEEPQITVEGEPGGPTTSSLLATVQPPSYYGPFSLAESLGQGS